MLTVPSTSPFRASEKLSLILESLSMIGIQPKLYTAADSDDVQLYIAFSEAVKTEEMTGKIAAFLITCGFDHSIVAHGCEKPFALPLQPGFAWLNDLLEPKVRREEISLPAAIAIFLRDLESSTACPHKVEAALVAETPTYIQAATISNSDDLALVSSTNSPACEETLQVVNETAVEPNPEAEKTEEIEFDVSVPPAAPQIAEHSSTETAIAEHLPGMQLLLFAAVRPPETSTLPKGRPKHGKRPRSNLPDSSEAAAPAQTKVFPINTLAYTAPSLFDKEEFETE